MDQRAPRLGRQLGSKAPSRQRGTAGHVGGQDRVAALGEDLGETFCEDRIRWWPRRELGRPGAEIPRPTHRDDRRGESLGDAREHPFVARAGAVDLVDEQQRGHAQSLEGAHQDACLRLDALDGRDHQDGAVEHRQGAIDLGDEVRVARRVDQVDGQVTDRERRDGRLDRDAALLFERHGVGLRRTGVDAADFLDDAGCIQQPLCEGRLTGVDVCEDPEVQRVHAAFRPSNRQIPS